MFIFYLCFSLLLNASIKEGFLTYKENQIQYSTTFDYKNKKFYSPKNLELLNNSPKGLYNTYYTVSFKDNNNFIYIFELDSPITFKNTYKQGELLLENIVFTLKIEDATNNKLINPLFFVKQEPYSPPIIGSVFYVLNQESVLLKYFDSVPLGTYSILWYAYDSKTQSPPYSAELYIDNTLFYRYAINAFDLTSKKLINGHPIDQVSYRHRLLHFPKVNFPAKNFNLTLVVKNFLGEQSSQRILLRGANP